jgi:transcription antitermination factor NusG
MWLKKKGYEVFCPTYIESRQYSDRIKRAEVALFAGYTFCRMDIEKRLPVLTTAGVREILSVGGIPAPISENEIENIRRAVTSGSLVQPWPYLKKGHRVRIQCGCLAGVEGVLISVKGSDKLVLSIDILQRSVCVEVDRSWIRPTH